MYYNARKLTYPRPKAYKLSHPPTTTNNKLNPPKLPQSTSIRKVL